MSKSVHRETSRNPSSLLLASLRACFFLAFLPSLPPSVPYFFQSICTERSLQGRVLYICSHSIRPREQALPPSPFLHVMKLKQRWVWNPDAKPKPLTVGSAASKKVCNLSPVHHPALTRCGITGGPLREDTPGPCSSHPLPVSSEQRQGSLQASFSKTFCSPQPKAGLGSWANPLMQTHTSNFVACSGVNVRPQ